MKTTWKDYKTNGRDFKDLIHPSGVNEEHYFKSGLECSKYVINKCNLQKNDKILEYGCGNGRILKHLHNYNIWGVDLVQDFLDDGIKNGVKNLYNIKFDLNQKFNKIFSYTVFIHLNDEDTIKALKYIYDHLDDNGSAFLQIPLYDTMTPHDGNFICVRTWNTKELFPILHNIGFIIKSFKVSKDIFKYERIGKHHEEFIELTKK